MRNQERNTAKPAVYHSFKELAEAQREDGPPASVGVRQEPRRTDPPAKENARYFASYYLNKEGR